MPIKFRKTQLNITYLGKFTFIIGLILGLIYSITLLFLFNYLREIEFYFSFVIRDAPLTFKESDQKLIKLSYSLTSVCLGFSVCLNYWFNQKRGFYYKYIATQTLFIFWLVLFSFNSFSKPNPELISYQYFSEVYFVLDKYKILLFLIPIYIYLYNWGLISRKLNCTKWKLYSALIISSISILTYLNFSTFNTSFFRDHYSYNNKWKEEYLMNEITNSKNNYNITFDSLTISALSKSYTKTSIKFNYKINEAFNRKTTVALDTIIFAKILVNNKLNFKHRFPYPHPKAIYRQTRLFSKYSPEYNELINLLKLERSFINREIRNHKDYILLDYYLEQIINQLRLNDNFVDETHNESLTTKKQP